MLTVDPAECGPGSGGDVVQGAVPGPGRHVEAMQDSGQLADNCSHSPEQLAQMNCY